MLEVTLDEAKAQLEDLVQAAQQGEEVWIVSGGTPVQLVSGAANSNSKRDNPQEQQEEAVPARGFGSMRGTFTMAPDFDEPLEDFKEYM
jgi:prevent-host-death family protein